jgi:hypothetical protein
MKASRPVMTKTDRDYQAEDDHRTLARACEIRSDKSRMTAVRQHHDKAKRSLSTVGRMVRGR